MAKQEEVLVKEEDAEVASKKRWALFLIALCCFTTNMCFSARDGYLAIFASENHISG